MRSPRFYIYNTRLNYDTMQNENLTIPNIIKLNLGEFHVDHNDIMHIVANDHLITTDLLEKDYQAIKSFLERNQLKPPVVYDATNTTPIERKIRKRFEEMLDELFVSLAVVSDSKIGLAVANIFFALSKPRVPKRIFSQKLDAIQWSKENYQYQPAMAS